MNTHWVIFKSIVAIYCFNTAFYIVRRHCTVYMFEKLTLEIWGEIREVLWNVDFGLATSFNCPTNGFRCIFCLFYVFWAIFPSELQSIQYKTDTTYYKNTGIEMYPPSSVIVQNHEKEKSAEEKEEKPELGKKDDFD